jgi:hypothetical protein
MPIGPALLSDARTLAAYLIFLGPVAVAGLLVNWAVLHRIYARGSADRVAVAEVLSAPEFQHERVRKKPVIVLLIVLGGFWPVCRQP